MTMTPETLRPLGSRVLVMKDPKKETSASGLIIPANAQQVVTQGVVLATGPDVLEVSAMDRVLFGNMGGVEITFAGRTLYIFREEDLFGVFE